MRARGTGYMHAAGCEQNDDSTVAATTAIIHHRAPLPKRALSQTARAALVVFFFICSCVRLATNVKLLFV